MNQVHMYCANDYQLRSNILQSNFVIHIRQYHLQILHHQIKLKPNYQSTFKAEVLHLNIMCYTLI